MGYQKKVLHKIIFFFKPKIFFKKMSRNTKAKDLNYYIDWLENSITEKHIKLYEYSDFENIQPIGSGSYGNVVRVNRKNTNRFFALKSFINNKQPLKELVKEV